MAWAYFCWRDGGGFVTSTFPPTAGLAVCCGGRIFGGLPSAGQNDRGGFPRPRRDYGGFLTGATWCRRNGEACKPRPPELSTTHGRCRSPRRSSHRNEDRPQDTGA
ncbi:hypothetical protein NDU88_005984 [Pleurodeles waltl]|uniref:Uncharacterized protein n=1 Tax=Pleurodeles waltl TaxID=8319 RepID=A0AAV7NP00_PLEWA|nr:hypothetical protein NDU88_005984 [Pleurodeles waltl]